jgi:hypothetical protein
MDNPKTGCSTLKSALMELELKDADTGLDCLDWRNIHDRSVTPFLKFNELRSAAPLSRLAKENYKFITFVRNPYTRLLSCYRDKILKGRRQKQRILESLGYSQDDMDRPISFEDFVKVVASQPDIDMDPHWRVQTSHVLYDLLDYAFVGRFEQYQEDYTRLFEFLGIPVDKIPVVRHLNRTKDGDQECADNHYTKELQDLVYERYKADFMNFGYGYELPG